MLSVFLVHAASDAPFARELADFIEAGCDEVRIVPDTVVRPDFDLISTAETGLTSDVVVLLLSHASNPARWVREKWEPVLSEGSVRIATVLLEECRFPELLRRRAGFFDATADRLVAMRQLKRWLSGSHWHISPDLEILYRTLGDRPGILTTSGAIADHFVREASRDFAAVARIAAPGRTLVQIVGEIGAQLEIQLDGELEANCRRLREVFATRRFLVVLDSPSISLDAILPSERTSILYTDKTVQISDDRSISAARRLFAARRFAEAYEIFYELLNAGVEPEACARDLAWICDHWDRVEEANTLRFRSGPAPAQQLRLF